MIKKKYINRLSCKFRKFFSRKIYILFCAPASHHVDHLQPVLNNFAGNKKYNITVIGAFSGINGIKVLKSKNSLRLTSSFDIVVSTEIDAAPWWLEAKKVFFGHGIGPKMNYQTTDEIADYDYSFCPCQPIYAAHKHLGVTCFKIGLPILDNPPHCPDSKYLKYFRLNESLPTLLYVPSWCSDFSKVSDIKFIIDKLKTITSVCNVIISPHPNLLNPSMCNNEDKFQGVDLPVNSVNSKVKTYDLLSISDFVLGDISSVMFEALALGKKVFRDGNDEIYRHCEAEYILEQIGECIPVIDWEHPLFKQLQDFKGDDGFFIDNYLFNRGGSVAAFSDAIEKISLFERTIK